VAEALFNHMDGKDLEAAQAALDDGNPHVTGFEIPGAKLTLDVKVERERRTGHSVVGYLPASEARREQKPWVVLGAHFDHLGKGRSANSLARKEEADGIHYGADDNASGVATLLQLVQDVKELPRHRDLLVAFWSGEELGLIGSSDFLKNAVVPPDQIAAYLNFDMVGRVSDGRLSVQAAGSSPVWPTLIEESNVPVGLDLGLRDDPYLPTDTLAFNQAKVPSLDFFSGSHEDYHRPTDTAEKLNYDAMEKVARLGALLAMRVANMEEPPDFVSVAPTRSQGGDRDTVRAFTGTIPDYTAEVEGLRLSGVIEGGPADEAGLQEGDVIVEFAGQTIANIYDYTYALDSVKIGEAVPVVLLRDGERMEVTITPRARN
jgi:Iap family predicted aminopeptidase